MKNIFYPYNILNEDIYPLFGEQIKGFPHYVDLFKRELTSVSEANEQTFGEIKKAGKNWGYSGYLENRRQQLKTMKFNEERRFFHLGLDLYAPVGIKLYAPLDGEIVMREYEDGIGNYGGMIVIRHNINGAVFYSLYGHLSKKSLLGSNSTVKRGEEIGEIGDESENGNWSYHTH
ncbi:MAG: peptidoglycan DD-metalloendopeptidase family protein, partial [Rickettsiales bacterium]|nr:peptidoglycan DD-metalloendopeptidase family protein [Rickettsiales bacterium]